jgi:hypothetical protein
MQYAVVSVALVHHKHAGASETTCNYGRSIDHMYGCSREEKL